MVVVGLLLAAALAMVGKWSMPLWRQTEPRRVQIATEIRTKEMISSMFVFSLLIMFIFNFAFDLRAENVRALAPGVLEQFRAELESDPEATLNRFYALQTRAGGRPKPALAKRLKTLAAARGLPARASLLGALEVLAESDLRRDCKALRRPVLFILGADDALVPVAVADDIPALNPSLSVEVVAGAGHAPFLSHPKSVTRQIRRFLETLGAERKGQAT